jgi:hypothetical protein
MSRLLTQLHEAVAALSVCDPPPALIGGLALAAHGVVRATSDIDFLLAARSADSAEQILVGLGYAKRFRSDDAANYVRSDEGLDFLYARRPQALRLLSAAAPRDVAGASVRVVSAEGLIGFKLQAWVNDPRRTLDLDDIRGLLRENAGRLDLDEVRQYFRLFDRENLLEELARDADG